MKRCHLYAPLTTGILVYVTNTYLVFHIFQYAICYQSINVMTPKVREEHEVYYGISKLLIAHTIKTHKMVPK